VKILVTSWERCTCTDIGVLPVSHLSVGKCDAGQNNYASSKAAFLRLVYLTHAPVIVHSTRRQVNNCHTVPRTGQVCHAHIQHTRPVHYDTPDRTKQRSHVTSRETNNSCLLTTLVTALSRFPTVGEGRTGDQYFVRMQGLHHVASKYPEWQTFVRYTSHGNTALKASSAIR